MITSENYVEGVLRTDCLITPELIARVSNPETIRLLHAAMGMATEAAELIDMLKKHLFYGKPLDMVNASEEVGDELWYVGLAIDVMKTTMNEVLTQNNRKLRLRFPEQFTEHHAENRDLGAERLLLEGEAKPLSQRGKDWQEFAAKVLDHIENYTVPQYGDAPNDLAETWTPRQSLDCVDRYSKRYGRNSRDGQQALDFTKMAHYVQLAYLKHVKETTHATR